MQIRLRDLAIVVLAVCGFAISFPGASAQQSDDDSGLPGLRLEPLPKNGQVKACVDTILYGDLPTANDDDTFTPEQRQECLKWLKARAGAQIEEENRKRAVALSLDDEIKKSRAGQAAARAAEIIKKQLSIEDEGDLPSRRTPPAEPPKAGGNNGTLPDRKPAPRLSQLNIEASRFSDNEYAIKTVKSGSHIISCGGVNRISKPPLFLNKTFRGSGSISIIDAYFSIEAADTTMPISVRIGNHESVIQSAVNRHLITIPFSKSELVNIMKRGLEINSKAVDRKTLNDLDKLVTRCLKKADALN